MGDIANDRRPTGQGGPETGRHHTAWDEAKIARFWADLAPMHADLFYSKRAGEFFLDCVQPVLGRRVLDVGCGDGTLVAMMRDRGWDASGVDPAPPEGNVHLLRLQGTELASLGERFDSAVSMEVLEHVLPEQLPATLRAIAAVLKPGAPFCFTTPFEEDMGKLACVCPDCRAVFHRWQHQQSFDVAKLSNLLAGAGFGPPRFALFAAPRWRVAAPRPLRAAYVRQWARLARRWGREVSVLGIARSLRE